VSRGCWNIKLDVRLTRNLCRSAGARFAVCAAICFAGLNTVEAETSEREMALTAYEACVSRPAAAISVTWQPTDGVFRAASGERYFASDVHLPGFGRHASAGDDLGTNSRVDLQAIPLGPANRWGLVPAWIVQVDEEEKRLLQFADLQRGKALYAPDQSSGVCAGFLRHAEASARKNKKGIWDSGSRSLVYSASAPRKLEKAAGAYVIAQGRIVSLGNTRSTRYLNFGKYWKTDFTVTLKTSDEGSFNTELVHSGWRIDALAGQVVELRGVVQLKDGPHIALTHPGQLVVLENKRAGRGGQDSN
jgi:hypothetical protein